MTKIKRTIAAVFCCCTWSGFSADDVRADLVIPTGQTYVGAGIATGRVENHGVITSGTSDRFVFGPETVVQGSGHFENTLSWGVFAPGNSPGITSSRNIAFGGTLEIELGGTNPGFGSGKHDQINDTATITLFDNLPVLSILSFEGFIPTPGDEFEILTWQTGLVGSFSAVLFDNTFTVNNITFEQIITNPTGAGNFTLRAVAVPEARVCGCG